MAKRTRKLRHINHAVVVKMICMYLMSVMVLIYETKGQDAADSLFINIPAENRNIYFSESATVDFLQIKSSVTDSVRFAIVVFKPEIPSPVLLVSHGWHLSVKPPSENSVNPFPGFLTVQVDMRGRKYSTGKPDCNGLELYDFYDAYHYVVRNYRRYISDTSQVYYFGESGGGGNGYAIIGKFPDLFCSAVIACGMSDYAEWYRNDSIGAYRDEMIPWIGYSPDGNPEAYRSRSGIFMIDNVVTPVYIVHGETDISVPVSHARNYVKKARGKGKEVYYLELKNVGDQSHWSKISEQQQIEKNELIKAGLQIRKPPELPVRGKLVVPGYVVTKRFSVFMDSIDHLGIVRYNLKKDKVRMVKGNEKTINHY